MARHGQWAGERGRQLARALQRIGADLEPFPRPTETSSTGARGPVRRWIQTHIPHAWRGPVIALRLWQRGTVNTVRWSWRLVRAFRGRRPDVIVARYFEFDLTPLVVSRVLGRPLILETHSPFGLENALRDGRSSRVAGWIDRRMFAAADRIWVHTTQLRDLVTDLTGDPTKIEVIHFGVEGNDVLATPADSSPPVEIVFVGSFYPWHGVDELLKAYSQIVDQVPDVHLTVIGDGLTRADSEELAGRLGLTQSVSFPGWLERDELYETLARSHIGVAPYLELTYNYFEPVKIRDFQMAGLPVVASAVGEIPQMVDDGESGLLVKPGDIDGLATTLAKLVSDPQLRGAMGTAARTRALAIDRTAQEVLALCEAVVLGP